MGFKEDLQRLSVQIAERKDHVANEEMAKQALIIPFLQVLGFDVFNPLEVRPEYVADFGKKKGEKVDYAVFKDKNPIMFIEAKGVNEKLENHDAQLARYFNSTPEVKLGIITNGVEYKFFTDLDTNNIMDDAPFLRIDITNLSENDIESLSKFRKEAFETCELVSFAEELIYTSNLNKKLEELFKNPSDEFIRLLIKSFSDSRITTNVVERFRPIVKKSISSVLLKMVSQGLFPQEEAPAQEEIITEAISPGDAENEKPKAITTDEELKAFDIVKNILITAGRNVTELSYKDTINYIGIHNRVTTNWILRLMLDGNRKNLLTRLSVEKAAELSPEFKVEEAPKGHGLSRVYINSADDLCKLNKLIVQCFDEVVNS